MISSRCYFLLVSLLATFHLCNVIATKTSLAKMVKGSEQDKKDILTNFKHDDRALTVWVEPKYWNSYNKCFTSTRLNKCLLIKAPPLQGSLCLSGLLGWHSCFFGAHTCTAITGPLPGLGNLNCVGLGLDHPKTRCDCNNGAWNCYDWMVCQASPTLQPLPSSAPVPTYLRTPRPTPVPTPLPTPVPTPLPTPVPTPLPAPVPVPTPIFCGGIAGILCPDGLICIDNPNDYCDPMNGGADCGGLCIVPDIPQSCTSNGLSPCPYGQTCFDLDQTDSCSLLSSCPGVCVSIPPPSGCGGQLDIQCPSGQICIDDLTNCGLAGGCLGKCILAPIAESLCSECLIESPLTLLNDLVCANQLTCTYGKESCCGSTYDSLICSCQPGTGFFCYATDKCLSSVCAPKPPVDTLLPPVGTVLPPVGTVLLPKVSTVLPSLGTTLPTEGALLPTEGTVIPSFGTFFPPVGKVLPPVRTAFPPIGYSPSTSGHSTSTSHNHPSTSGNYPSTSEHSTSSNCTICSWCLQ